MVAGLTDGFAMPPRIAGTTPGRTIRAWSHRPIAGISAATVLLSLVPARALGINALMAVVGIETMLLALMLTSVDDAIVRFMSIAGHGSRRIVVRHASGLASFLAVAVPACWIMLAPVAAGIVAATGAAMLLLLILRVFAYRLHSRRFAELLVSILVGFRRGCRTADAEPSADQLRRLRFIERAALWTGQVGRRAVAIAFDVSVGHVTLDFQRYREMAPHNLGYDVAEKCFRPTELFKPIFGDADPASVLNTIAATAALPQQERGRLLGFAPSVDVVQAIPVAIDQDLLIAVCRGITAGTTMAASYQSMNTPQPQPRTFAPHALIFTGQRWLVRGWDSRHQAFRDLALARFLSAREAGPANGVPRDDRWHDRATLEFCLIDGLSPSQAVVSAREFGMTSDKGGYSVSIQPRQALIPYVLDHFRLRPTATCDSAVPIRLRNYSEIQQFDRAGDGL